MPITCTEYHDALPGLHASLPNHYLNPRPALRHQVLLLPLVTAARLPLGSAQVAELVATAARDVVAAMVQGHNEPECQATDACVSSMRSSAGTPKQPRLVVDACRTMQAR
jgi:hypothetical protein